MKNLDKKNLVTLIILSLSIKLQRTRMHSSRMRTGRALTISGGGASQKDFFWGKEIEKKKKKKFGGTPPQKFQTPQNSRHPQKIPDPPKNSRHPPKNSRHPPKNSRHPPKISDTPRKFQTPQNSRPPQNFRHPPGPGQVPTPLRGQTHACKLITLAQLRCGR